MKTEFMFVIANVFAWVFIFFYYKVKVGKKIEDKKERRKKYAYFVFIARYLLPLQL